MLNVDVFLSNQSTLPLSEGAEEGSPVRWIEASIKYTVSPRHIISENDTVNKYIPHEGKDREWFEFLKNLNPTLQTLGEAVSCTLYKIVDAVRPNEVSMAVTLSNDPDGNGFCTKTVNLKWVKD